MSYLIHLLRIFPVQIPEMPWVAKSNNFKWGLNKSVKTKPISALFVNKGFTVNNKVKLKLVGGSGAGGKEEKWILIYWESSNKCRPLRSTLSFQAVCDVFFFSSVSYWLSGQRKYWNQKELLYPRRMKEGRQIKTIEDLF